MTRRPTGAALYADGRVVMKVVCFVVGLAVTAGVVHPAVPGALRQPRPGAVRDLPNRHDPNLRPRDLWHLDYAVAIEEGATLVRVGSAIFGSR